MAIAVPSHYDVLGVDADASNDEIRIAYRNRARLHHPDRATASDTVSMAAVNEAYRVLSDPGRRALYDRDRCQPAAEPPTEDIDMGGVPAPGEPPSEHQSWLSPPGPARMPWKSMAVVAVIGSAVVLVTSVFNDPPSVEPPDGIMRAGSCVEIEPNLDVREIACTGDGDLVVELLIPVGARCPAGLLGYRDRLGLGTVCLEG